MVADILDQLMMEDLDEEQHFLASTIGFDNYKELVKIYGGSSIYIPKKDSLAAILRNKEILSEFDGGNFRELATKYNITEVWVRNLVRERLRELRIKPLEGQMSIEDLIL